MQIDQAVANEATGEAAEQDCEERCSARRGRRKRREWAVGGRIRHAVIVDASLDYSLDDSLDDSLEDSLDDSPTTPSLMSARFLAVRAVVVIPTYNEAQTIEAIMRGVRAAAPGVGILVVDDNSPDGTADLAEKIGAAVGDAQVLRRPAKSGLGGAYRAGMRQAIDGGAEICVQMDADYSHDPVYLPALLSAVEHGVDLAMGSRYVPGGVTADWPASRRRLSRWGNRYAAGVLGLAINDATGGYRAYSAAALEHKMQFETIRTQGYGFQVEMTHRLVRAGGSIVEFPITFRDRTAGSSKMSQNIISEAFVLVLKLWVQDRRGRRERRLSGM